MALSASASAEPRFYAGATLGASMFDGEATSGRDFPSIEEGIPIDHQNFDSTETAWGALLGWKVNSWLALEGGYSDLGNAGETIFVAVLLPPDGEPPDIVTSAGVALGIEEWHVGTRFSVPLSSRFRANWFAGFSRASFDVQGVTPIYGFGPPVFASFVSPDDQNGFVWGFGFGWKANEWLSLDLGFRRHDTQVLEVDAVSLGALFSF